MVELVFRIPVDRVLAGAVQDDVAAFVFERFGFRADGAQGRSVPRLQPDFGACEDFSDRRPRRRRDEQQRRREARREHRCQGPSPGGRQARRSRRGEQARKDRHEALIGKAGRLP